MTRPAALRAAEEVSDQVFRELVSLPQSVSSEVAASVALAMVAGAARAYRQISDDGGGRTLVETRLAAAAGVVTGH